MPRINSFTAIDFETSNPARYSICQVGIVQVSNGEITQKIKLLIQPPKNEYSKINTSIHGITPNMTINAETFDKAWGKKIKQFVDNQNVVAHNGHSFDFNCLEQALKHYRIALPKFNKYCTYQIYKSKLDVLCKQYNISIDHHDALSDAMACAELFLIYLKTNN